MRKQAKEKEKKLPQQLVSVWRTFSGLFQSCLLHDFFSAWFLYICRVFSGFRRRFLCFKCLFTSVLSAVFKTLKPLHKPHTGYDNDWIGFQELRIDQPSRLIWLIYFCFTLSSIQWPVTCHLSILWLLVLSGSCVYGIQMMASVYKLTSFQGCI